MKMEARLCARPIHVSVVQWIEYRIPVPTIGVRLPTGIQKPPQHTWAAEAFIITARDT